MTPRRLAALTGLIVCLAVGSIPVASASASPIWNLEMHHNETHFSPGGSAEYWIDLANVGETASSGPLALTVELPAGVDFAYKRENKPSPNTEFYAEWSCPTLPGASVVTCTTSTPIPRHETATGLALGVDISSLTAEGAESTAARVEGGGAAAATDTEPVEISSTPADFGIVPGSFKADFVEPDGLTPVRESGAHPDLATFAFDFNSVVNPQPGLPEQKAPKDTVRDLKVDLPPGFVGYPTAVGECLPAELLAIDCPPSSQVGVLEVTTMPTSFAHSTFEKWTTGVFNMAHPRGVVTDLGFSLAGNPAHIRVSLDPQHDYAITSSVPNINESLPVFNQKLTLWGVPADHSHDSQRCPGFTGGTSSSCSTETSTKPFLTVPSACNRNDTMRLRDYDSWQNTGAFGPEIDYQMPGQITNCDRPRFEPSVEVDPTGHQANTPTGLEVHVKVPQNDNPNALATPPVKRVKITFPEGMTVSPSFANGLTGCGLEEIGLGNDQAVACPDSSRIGAVSLSTPVLPKELEGSLYLAKQQENPFGSTFAVYLALHDNEERGILVKVPGRLDLDPNTGQITSTFGEAPYELPQFPFEEFTLSFRSGDRAPLINPPSCGLQTIGAQVASFAQPDKMIDVSSTYDVTQGANGQPCPPDLGSRPFGPKMDAGTVSPSAGSYSPFVFHLTRQDQEQEIGRVTTVLPPGLTAKIAGIPYCSDAAIASISQAEGTGRAQLEHPGCPAASRIGTVSTGVGAGNSPAYFDGSVYLAGAYHGAPLSLAIVVPAVAGPYDLGNVVVRAAAFVDPTTAQVRVVSDSLPTIVHGVLLRVRDIRLSVDRHETTLNPTSCDPMAVGGTALSTSGATAPLSTRFQAGNCARLGFKPQLSFRLKGGTHRGGYPALRATLKARPGDANIGRVSVGLPHSEFLAQEHIRTICTRVQFAADNCPAASIYGHARAITPLLDHPLEGPVYLRSSSHPLPDLVVKLNGQFEVDLVGRIDSHNGGIRNTFSVVPDAPVTEFTLSMRGGQKGLLVNSRNICATRARATVRMVAQSNKTQVTHPAMVPSCRKRSKGSGRH